MSEPDHSTSAPSSPEDTLVELATACGFDRVGFAPPAVGPEGERFQEWLRRGFHGQMDYLAREPQRRFDPAVTRPWVRSVVALAVDYHTDHPLSIEVPDDADRGWISRYAWGRDYHDVIEKKLKALARELEPHPTLGGRYHYYVDHGPVMEKAFAARAGLGWQGKNTMLVHPRAGSWFFLALLLTDRDFRPSEPVADHCGSCRRCLDACPTNAFVEPYVLDATRCISYLTIETSDPVPEEHREATGFHVFGCDLCQDVCPFNRKAPFTQESEFEPRAGLVHPQLADLEADDEQAFRARHTKSPLKRRKHAGLALTLNSASHRKSQKNFPAPAETRALRIPRNRPQLPETTKEPPPATPAREK